MIYRFTCTEQEPESFDIRGCYKRRHFEINKGKTTSYKCRKQKDSRHKRDFEGAILSQRLGIPDTVEIVEAAK